MVMVMMAEAVAVASMSARVGVCRHGGCGKVSCAVRRGRPIKRRALCWWTMSALGIGLGLQDAQLCPKDVCPAVGLHNGDGASVVVW